jgi:hypothetical protein
MSCGNSPDPGTSRAYLGMCVSAGQNILGECDRVPFVADKHAGIGTYRPGFRAKLLLSVTNSHAFDALDCPAAFSVSRPSPSGRISRTPRPSSSASGKTVRSSDGVTRLAASPSQGLRPSAGWPIPFLTGHRANRPRRGGAVLMLHCMRVTRESLERRGGSRHD